jgi:hypothetical protein
MRLSSPSLSIIPVIPARKRSYHPTLSSTHQRCMTALCSTNVAIHLAPSCSMAKLRSSTFVCRSLEPLVVHTSRWLDRSLARTCLVYFSRLATSPGIAHRAQESTICVPLVHWPQALRFCKRFEAIGLPFFLFRSDFPAACPHANISGLSQYKTSWFSIYRDLKTSLNFDGTILPFL